MQRILNYSSHYNSVKRLFIVLDGSGDRDYKELGGKSPLGYARTPNIDSLAPISRMGRVDVVRRGVAPESDSAVMSLLGYDVFGWYPGRGVIEALGAGFKIDGKSIFFRANFATIDNNWNLIDTRANRIGGEKADKVAKHIRKIEIDGVVIEFKHTVGHRGIVKVSGDNLSPYVSGNHNGYGIVRGTNVSMAKVITLPAKLSRFRPTAPTEKAKRTAKIMNHYVKEVYERLKDLPINKRLKYPANMLLLRGAGNKFKPLPSLKKRTGLNWASIVEMPVEEGICKLTSMDVINVGEVIESEVRRTKRYLEETLSNIDNYDALYIHIKGPDIPGHDGDLKKKIRSIEIIDRYFFKGLLSSIDLNQTSIVVTADHSTECALKAHSARPTPLMIYKPGVKGDNLPSFSEDNCSKGSIGRIRGVDIMNLIV